MYQAIASFIANILQRAFGSKPSTMLTVTGLVAALAAGLAAFPPAVLPPKYQPYLVGVAGVLGAVAGILGHGTQTPPPAAN